MYILFSLNLMATLVILASSAANAQTTPYPNKPIRLIVPFVPGGGGDVIARVIARPLTEALGQQIIVDNRAGAGGTIGAEMVVRSTPDGYTLIMVTGSYAATPSLQKLPYHPVNDIAAIALVARGAFVLVAHPSLHASNVKELIALARSKPHTLNFGSAGIASTTYLIGEMLKSMAGIHLTHVPYKGGGAALADVVAGQIQLLFLSLAPALPQIKGGKVKALAVTSAKRAAALPQVATVSESGINSFEATNWYGMWGPKGMPKNVIARLNDEINRIIQSSEMMERFFNEGLEATPTRPDEFERVIKRDVEQWIKVVRLTNLKAE